MWHILAFEKVKFFLWMTLYKSLPTKLILCHHGMLQTNLCFRCNQDFETTQDCRRDCEFATRFWKFISILDPLFFQGDNLYDWIRDDISDLSIFLDACWWSWGARNKVCIANEVVSFYTLKLITINYPNLLAKYFLKHNLSHSTKTIM